MITEERLKHILSVARSSYNIAKEIGLPEDECKICFLNGWLHDIGYEFGDNTTHAEESAKLFDLLTGEQAVRMRYSIINHGKPDATQTDYLKLLNFVDMQTGPNGVNLSFDKRLEDIGIRYGKDSKQYHDFIKLMKNIGVYK